MKTTQKQQARDLFFSTDLSRKEISETVKIDEKTLYLWIKKEAWDEHKKAAHAAPAIIVDNLCYMLVELQDHIAERARGLRFPTAQEADTMRKLINSITKIKEYTSVGANMQMMVDFTNYVGADKQFCTQLQAYAESYFTARKANPRYNNAFGFEAEQSSEAAEAELKIIKDNIAADLQRTANEDTDIEFETTDSLTEITEIPDSIFPAQSGILSEDTPETLISKAIQDFQRADTIFPASGKIGNSSGKFKRPAFLYRSKKASFHISQPLELACSA